MTGADAMTALATFRVWATHPATHLTAWAVACLAALAVHPLLLLGLLALTPPTHAPKGARRVHLDRVQDSHPVDHLGCHAPVPLKPRPVRPLHLAGPTRQRVGARAGGWHAAVQGWGGVPILPARGGVSPRFTPGRVTVGGGQ